MVLFILIVGEGEERKEERGAKASAGAWRAGVRTLAVDGSLYMESVTVTREPSALSSAEASPSLAPPRGPKSEGSRPSFQATCHSVLLRPTSSQSNCPYTATFHRYKQLSAQAFMWIPGEVWAVVTPGNPPKRPLWRS
jgi:hypothetical protein